MKRWKHFPCQLAEDLIELRKLETLDTLSMSSSDSIWDSSAKLWCVEMLRVLKEKWNWTINCTKSSFEQLLDKKVTWNGTFLKMIWTREVQRVRLIPVVQRVDNTIQRINRYPKDTKWTTLSTRWRFIQYIGLFDLRTTGAWCPEHLFCFLYLLHDLFWLPSSASLNTTRLSHLLPFCVFVTQHLLRKT